MEKSVPSNEASVVVESSKEIERAKESQTDSLELVVVWEDGVRDLKRAEPAAIEVAGLLMGLEEVYEALASALGYPPHFLKVTAVRNAELTFNLKGAKPVIKALGDLVFALPSLIANLFLPNVALSRAKLKNDVLAKQLEAQAAKADAQKASSEADKVEALTRRVKAEAELNTLLARRMPIEVNETAHALVEDVVIAFTQAEPSLRLPFIGDTVRYAAVGRSFEPRTRIKLVPVTPVLVDGAATSQVQQEAVSGQA